MSPLFVLLLSVTCHITYSSSCDDFQANFDWNKVIGEWQVVAIIPEQYYPIANITLDKVEFREMSEEDVGFDFFNLTLTNSYTHGQLKFQEDVRFDLFNLTLVEHKTQYNNGLIIRQRFFTEHQFDILSMAYANVSGCFHQAMVLHGMETLKDFANGSMMQLHLIDTGSKTGLLLVQMLYGQTISAAVFRRNRGKGVTEEELKPVLEVLTKLRGPQRSPIIFK